LGRYPQTMHALDMGRFWDFVDQYNKDHGFSVDEMALRDLMCEKEKALSGGCSEEMVRIFGERISLMLNVLEFLKHTDR
jgi:hypothetical protein